MKLREKVLTADDIIALGPCWIDEDRDDQGPGHRLIRSLCPVSLADVADMRKLRQVSAAERVWLISVAAPQAAQRLFAIAVATRTLRWAKKAGADHRSWEAVCADSAAYPSVVLDAIYLAEHAVAARRMGSGVVAAREERRWQLRWWRRALKETGAEA